MKKAIKYPVYTRLNSGSGGGSEREQLIKLAEGEYIENLVIPEGTTKIGEYVFYQSRIYNVSIPNTVTSIEASGFSQSSFLGTQSTVILPGSITIIKGRAFYMCPLNYGLELQEGLEKIETDAFGYCSYLQNLVFPSTVKTISSQAFNSCTRLKTVTFLGKPTSINSSAFYSCTAITSIRVPWSSGQVSGAPWGATKASITYNYTP